MPLLVPLRVRVAVLLGSLVRVRVALPVFVAVMVGVTQASVSNSSDVINTISNAARLGGPDLCVAERAMLLL